MPYEGYAQERGLLGARVLKLKLENKIILRIEKRLPSCREASRRLGRKQPLWQSCVFGGSDDSCDDCVLMRLDR